MSEWISTRQAAELIGVSPRRVRKLVELRADFPRPLDIDGDRFYFNRADVEQWAQTADRRAGRRWPPEGEPRPRSTR